MKSSSLSLLLLISACTSVEEKPPKISAPAPVLTSSNDQFVNCSPKGLESLKKAIGDEVPHFMEQNDLKARLADGFIPASMKCYKEELERTDNTQPFNVCLILRTDAKGKLVFSDFHTNEIKPTQDFYGCLTAALKPIDFSIHKLKTFHQNLQMALD